LILKTFVSCAHSHDNYLCQASIEILPLSAQIASHAMLIDNKQKSTDDLEAQWLLLPTVG